MCSTARMETILQSATRFVEGDANHDVRKRAKSFAQSLSLSPSLSLSLRLYLVIDLSPSA